MLTNEEKQLIKKVEETFDRDLSNQTIYKDTNSMCVDITGHTQEELEQGGFSIMSCLGGVFFPIVDGIVFCKIVD